MNLTSRPATVQDFDEFYRTFFPNDRHNSALHYIVEREWAVLLRNPTTLSLMIEDKARPPGQRVVACAQAVFVTKHFAQLARTGLPPWINAHATAALPDGAWPLLSPAEVRVANSGTGLIVLMTRWMMTDEPLHPEEASRLRAYLFRSWITFTQGYKLQEVFIEVTGERPRREAQRAGYQLLHDYHEHYQRHPPVPAAHQHPYLLHLTREEALANEGTLTSHAFAYTPPQCYFTEGQQELLRLALAGAEDAEMSALLGRTKGALHKRWEKIYDRVEQQLPALLPTSAPAKVREGKRGAEKRRVLLKYLQEHPEEMRPVNPPINHRE